MGKYTREQALRILKRNGVEVKKVVVPKDPRMPLGDTLTLHYIGTRGLGIKLQGVADFLINHHYDMVRR